MLRMRSSLNLGWPTNTRPVPIPEDSPWLRAARPLLCAPCLGAAVVRVGHGEVDRTVERERLPIIGAACGHLLHQLKQV